MLNAPHKRRFPAKRAQTPFSPNLFFPISAPSRPPEAQHAFRYLVTIFGQGGGVGGLEVVKVVVLLVFGGGGAGSFGQLRAGTMYGFGDGGAPGVVQGAAMCKCCGGGGGP